MSQCAVSFCSRLVPSRWAEKNLTHCINLKKAPANASKVEAISNHGDVLKYWSAKYPITRPPRIVPGSSNATPIYKPARCRKEDELLFRRLGRSLIFPTAAVFNTKV